MQSTRPAIPANTCAISRDHAHHVPHGTGGFETAPPSKAKMTRRNVTRDEEEPVCHLPCLGAKHNSPVVLYTCECARVRKLIAAFGDSGNHGTMGAHAAASFVHAAILRSVGIEMMNNPLGAGDSTHPA